MSAITKAISPSNSYKMKLYKVVKSHIWKYCLLLLVCTMPVSAQNTIAKIKYEQAEEAFANNDYRLALQKIIETEEILKSSNPKTLHLKIMSQYKLLDQDYSVIADLKKNAREYISKYESVAALEDKFREVYLAWEEVSGLDESAAAIEQRKAQQAVKDVSPAAMSEDNRKAVLDYATAVSSRYGFVPNANWDLLKNASRYRDCKFMKTSQKLPSGKQADMYVCMQGVTSFASIMVDDRGTAIAQVFGAGGSQGQLDAITAELQQKVGPSAITVQQQDGFKMLTLHVPPTATTPEYYISYMLIGQQLVISFSTENTNFKN